MSNSPMVIDRVVACPDCYRVCGWCAWYAKNARDAGCGTTIRKSKKCEWEQLKGQACPTCGGTEKVKLVGEFRRLEIVNDRA